MLDGARAFVFDVDGTLVHRGPDGRARPQPDAVEVLDRIRSSGRRLVLFTNGSHVPSASIAQALREDGLPIADEEMLTPTDSAVSYLSRRHRGQPVMLFASPAITEWMAAAGVRVTDGEDAAVVFVAHLDHIDVSALERAARAILRGAPLLTSSYARGYAGANGIIFSRGRDDHRGDRQGHRRAAEGARQALAGRGARGLGAPGCAGRPAGGDRR